MGGLVMFFTASLCLYLLVALLNVLYKYLWIPHRIKTIMNSQGIKGPPYKFIHGNNKEVVHMQNEAYSKPMSSLTHDILPRVWPDIHYNINKYGKTYLRWNGNRAQLVIAEPELVKEVLRNSEKAYRKGHPTSFFVNLTGDGLSVTEKEKWARLRKLANYAFHGESLKSMNPAVVTSVKTMLKKWKGEEGKEIEVFEEFRLLTSEVISRTAFGSSYLEGDKIFEMLMNLSQLATRNLFKSRIPIISQFWKSADEIESDKLAKAIHDTLMKIVKNREEKVETGEADSFGNDYLGLLLNAYHDSDEKNRLSEQDLVDECKTFYFAGQETTNSLLGWTMFLLATHTDWQDKARTEVIEVFGNSDPDSEGIGKLKIMTMIINETLRLYPPLIALLRIVGREVQLGKLILPTNLELELQIMAMTHDPDLWGDDVHLFKPERFAEGIAKATNYNAVIFIPFGLGPRSCVGTSLSLTETKIALSMILQNYTFTLSPAYVHAPIQRIMLQPQHGLPLLFHSLHDDA